MNFSSTKPKDFKEKIYESKINILITFANAVGILLILFINIIMREKDLKSIDNLLVSLFLWVIILTRSLKPDGYPFLNQNIINISWVLLCIFFGVLIFILYFISEKTGTFTALLISTIILEIWIIFTYVVFIIIEIKNSSSDEESEYNKLEEEKKDDFDIKK